MASSKAKANQAVKAGKATKTAPKAKAAAGKKAPGSRIAELKNAIFGKGKKAAPPARSTGSSAASRASDMKKGQAPQNTKAAAGKAAAPAKGAKAQPAPAKAAAPAPAPAKGGKGSVAATVVGKVASALGTATRGKGKANKTGIVDYSRSLRATGATGITASSENICREVACEGLATTGGYCRLHYIKNWRKIQRKAGILKEGKLNRYIEELVGKYPEKYLEAIRNDLANDKEFAKVIYDLDLDEGVNEDVDVEQENMDGVIDTVRGGGRDFDDEGEAF